MKNSDFRKKIAEEFIASLKEDTYWVKRWSTIGKPLNAINNRAYNGINRLWLTYIQNRREYEDPRWCTFKQAQSKGWKIKKGEKASQVEYWMPYDLQEKKAVSWDDYRRLIKEEDFESNRYTLIARVFSVFNGSQIEGIPEYKMEKGDAKEEGIIKIIAEEMEVPIIHGGEEAYYNSRKDEVHLPKPERFRDQYSYDATALHELSHATGHETRLARDIRNLFGSEKYAFEELVAEISSAFLSDLVPCDMDGIHLDNHKAYINNWIEVLEKEPDVLFKAIKEAEKAADFIEEKLEQGLKKEKKEEQVDEDKQEQIVYRAAGLRR